jgi:hypothetical protein
MMRAVIAGDLAAEERAASRRPWARLKERAASLALICVAGCAHFEYASPEGPSAPRGPISVYPLESDSEPERIMVGTEANVLLRPRVMIAERERLDDITDYESRKGADGITYCWFVYQEAGYEQDGVPVLFLLNPAYKDYGQPRYIGALLHFGVDEDGRPIDAVVPVAPDETDPEAPKDTLWSFGGPPQRRGDALFFVYPGTVVPVMDAGLAGKLGEYCRETGLPQYQVVEYGPTTAALAVYPSRRREVPDP